MAFDHRVQHLISKSSVGVSLSSSCSEDGICARKHDCHEVLVVKLDELFLVAVRVTIEILNDVVSL